MQSRLVWIGCLIIVGTAVALWFLNQRDAPIEVSPPDISSDAPSVSFNDVKMLVNSPDGKPQYRLLASKYQLYDNEQRSEFDLPDITLYDNQGNRIYARALQGEAHNHTSVITLTGNVRINQAKPETGSHRLEIITDTLTVFPEKQRATTDSAITATRGSQRFSAQGMSLDLETEVLHLHSNVEGTYEP